MRYVMGNGKHIQSRNCSKSRAFDGIKHLDTDFQIKRLASIVIDCTIDVLFQQFHRYRIIISNNNK